MQLKQPRPGMILVSNSCVRGGFMNKWGGLIFMSLMVTSLAHGANQSVDPTSSNKTFLKGFNTKYYCQEFSMAATDKNNWRDHFLKEITPNKYPALFEDRIAQGAATDLIKYCPNYPNLDDDQKKIILLRLVDGMAFFESSCKTTAKAKGPNGTAFGILQLHLGREQDYARYCKKYDARNPKNSLTCGLDMLEDQVQNNKRIFSSMSYWDVLRPRGSARKAYTIASHLWYYPLCQIPKSSSETIALNKF